MGEVAPLRTSNGVIWIELADDSGVAAATGPEISDAVGPGSAERAQSVRPAGLSVGPAGLSVGPAGLTEDLMAGRGAAGTSVEVQGPSLEALLAPIGDVAAALMASLTDIDPPPAEATAEFGITLSGKLGVKIVEVAAQATIRCALTWRPADDPRPAPA